MNYVPKDPALRAAIMYHGAHQLARLRALPLGALRKVGSEASECAELGPLWQQPYASKKMFSVPAWGPQKLSGCQVIALMVFSLWVMCGEKEEMAGSLCDAWPVAEAVALSAVENASVFLDSKNFYEH